MLFAEENIVPDGKTLMTPPKSLDKLRWRAARLRAMTSEEIRWRLQLERVKARWRRKPPKPARLPNLDELKVAARLPFFGLPLARENLYISIDVGEIEALLEEADALLMGRWRFFAFAEPDTPRTAGTIDWQRDDRSGISADARMFGPDIDYRDAKRVGNVKYTWEKSRHHHTTVLALAWLLTGKEHYAQAALRSIESWLKHNPAPKGINWTSALEVGVRLISWAWVMHLLCGHPDRARVFTNPDFLESLYQHQCFLYDLESHGSSANNHLLGEASGLYVAAQTWPVFAESETWRAHAKDVLEREMLLQVFPSGINKEMGFEYHVFSTELLLLPAVLGAGRDDHFSSAYLERLALKIKALSWLRDVRGGLPRYGDADEGMAVQLQSRRESRADWLLNLGRRFLNVPVPEAQGGSLASTLMLGPRRHGEVLPVPEPVPTSFAYQDAGLYSLAFLRGTPNEVLVLADAGPLGYLSIAGHGHADALSFTLTVGGQPVLVDPGTFVYHGSPEWRRYFKSTRAHNTLELDDQDQSQMLGAFLWGNRANVSLERWEARSDGGSLRASHDGYVRLPGKPVHTRELELRGKKLTILDQVSGAGRHQISLYLHLHPDCQLVDEGHGRWRVQFPGGELLVRFDAKLVSTAHRGEDAEDARLGWYSPRFDVKVPTWTLFASRSSDLPLELKTVIEVL